MIRGVTITSSYAEKLDVFQSAAPYTLAFSRAPELPAKVFLNGLLMLEGLDYEIVGVALKFTGQQPGDHPIIQAMYWTQVE
jgi:hypothetical protein